MERDGRDRQDEGAERTLSSGTVLPEVDVPIYVPENFLANSQLSMPKREKASPEIRRAAVELYERAWENAINLLSDARILQTAGRFARAFAIAATALEEIGKSQYAADVSTGMAPFADFQKLSRDHRFKSAYTSRWVEFAPLVRAFLKDEPVANEIFQRRNDALYASPAKAVANDDFEADTGTMIGYTEAWLDRIWRQEEISERIGTKAFTK
jgi:AbiV family abortive infection protein